MKEVVWVYNANVEGIKGLIKSAGDTIGSVHFLKRKDGSLRKMAYRLHVVPENKQHKDDNGIVPVLGPARKDGSRAVVMAPRNGPRRKDVDNANKQLTVYDCNKVVNGERGAFRTVPLENVLQITVKGVKYIIKRDPVAQK